MRKRHLLGLLGLVLFALVLYRLGIRRSLEALLDADRGSFLLAILAFLLSQGVRLVKWGFFHRLGGVPAGHAAVAHFYFHLKLLGTLTPGRIGEFLPAIGAPAARGSLLSFTAYDRLVESMTTLLFGLAAFVLLLRAKAPAAFLPVSLLLLFVIGIAALFCWRNSWMTSVGGWLERRGARASGGGPSGRLFGFEARVAEGTRELRGSFRTLFRPHAASAALLLTLLAVAADLLFWWFVFRSVGIRLSGGLLVGAVAVFNVTGFFSPTPGGLGISDAAFVIFLRSAGVEGPFGSFLVLLRLIVTVFTALLAWVFSARLALAGRGNGAPKARGDGRSSASDRDLHREPPG
ncbi:MAG: flippase-like domain-containing protein [Candidatus Eisenbacteria bacterium]